MTYYMTQHDMIMIPGMCINGFVNTSVTSIERRFGFRSQESGLIVTCYDIAALAAVLPATYAAGRPGSRKPRWIAAGLVVMAAGSALWTLPHFATDAYRAGGDGGGTEVGVCGGATPGRGEGEECGADGEVDRGLVNYRSVADLILKMTR